MQYGNPSLQLSLAVQESEHKLNIDKEPEPKGKEKAV